MPDPSPTTSVSETDPDTINTAPGGSGSVLGTWGWEVAALVAAAGIATAIVIVLAKFNDEQLPNWPLGINLTTLISLLTLCLRTSLVVIATGVIGQSKWTWFSDAPRPLANFQTFDEASRGLTGSFKLISLLRLGYRGSPLAVLAAITTILSLAISPLTQQAIQTVPCLRVTVAQDAKIPIAYELPGSDGSFMTRSSTEWAGIGPKVQAAILSGLTNPHGNDSAIQPHCPTGNCTFPETLGVPHSTLGLCSQCLDTTSLLRVSFLDQDAVSMVRNVSLDDVSFRIHPPRTTLLYSGTHSDLSFADSIMTPGFRDASRHAFSNISILSWSQLATPNCGESSYYNHTCVIATTCSLHFCLKEITVSVVNGRLQENITKTVPAERNPPSAREFTPGCSVLKSPCLVDGKAYDTTNFSSIPIDSRRRGLVSVPVDGKEVNISSHCVYRVSGNYFSGLDVFFKKLFSGGCSQGLRDYMACEDSWWLGRFFNERHASFNTTSTIIHDTAMAVTNFFRVDGWGPTHNETVYKESKDPSLFKAFIQGEARQNTICLRFAWVWLIMPGILCLATILLLAGILFLGARSNRPEWKSSTLPLLFHGLDTKGADEALGKDLASLDKRAKNVTARLDLDSDLSSSIMVDLGVSKKTGSTEKTGGYRPLVGQTS